MRLLKYILVAALLVVLSSPAMAEEKEHGKFARFFMRVGDRMTESLMKGMDTTYVALPKNPFTAFAAYRLTSITHFIKNQYSPWAYNSEAQELIMADTGFEMTSGCVNAVGVGIGYRNTMVKYYYIPGKKNGQLFNVSSYGHRFGGEVMYQTIKSASCLYTAKIPDATGFDNEEASRWGNIAFSRLCLNAYWVISPKRFSYPAAMRSSVIQKRSAGSFIANLTYYRTTTDIFNKVTSIQWLMEDVHISTNQIGIGLGYAYNIVLPWKCMLIHIAATPMLTVNVKNGCSGRPSEFREIASPELLEAMDNMWVRFSRGHGVGFGCQGKVALSLPISERFYASVDCDLFYFGAGSYDGIHTHTFDATLNAVFGVRF